MIASIMSYVRWYPYRNRSKHEQAIYEYHKKKARQDLPLVLSQIAGVVVLIFVLWNIYQTNFG